jgi:hypothetical protein
MDYDIHRNYFHKAHNFSSALRVFFHTEFLLKGRKIYKMRIKFHFRPDAEAGIYSKNMHETQHCLSATLNTKFPLIDQEIRK